LFALANGALGVRGELEEDDSSSPGVFLAGVWERRAIDYHERFSGFARSSDTRVPIADGTHIRLQLGNEVVGMQHGERLASKRELNFRQGCYRRDLKWQSSSGAIVEVTAERLVALDVPGLLAIRYRVHSVDYCGPVVMESVIDTAQVPIDQGNDPRIGSRIDGGLHLCEIGSDEQLAWLRQETTYSGIRVVCGQTHRLPENSSKCLHVGQIAEGVSHTLVTELEPGGNLEVEKFVAYAWSQPGSDETDTALLNKVRNTLQDAVTAGYQSLQDNQTRILARFWDCVDLEVIDSPDIEQALRLNLFHIYQSTSRDSSGSVAAKGLTGEGYEGHYFWDAEAFMLPALVTIAPELAREMLGYRYHTLEHARAHAHELNHPNGALYAWRTISGDECSAYFPGGSAQYHINVAIAWAIRRYVDVSGDEVFLREYGAEMLFEMARIWMDIGHFNPRRDGAFCIHEVTGPDEYTVLVDNNHYTNRMAQVHLLDAAQTAEWLASTHPDAYAALAARIGLQEEEYRQWRRAAEAMYLPVDERLGIFPQDDTFLDKPRLSQQASAKRPLLLHLHPLTIYRHQVCKQADTVLALVLAGENVDRQAKRRNLEYYEDVTVHDSTLSASTFAVLAAEVGALDKAYKYFLESLRVDLDDLHGNAAHGVHLAAMAGSWLALTWGFGGMRVYGGQLRLEPRLPPNWQSYRFGVVWRNTRLRVAVDTEGVTYSLLAGNAIEFSHAGTLQHLNGGQKLHFPPLSPSLIKVPAQPLQAVIFDLDGVLADTAVLHQAAWQSLATELAVPFTPSQAERMKGLGRRASLEILLEHVKRPFSEVEKRVLSERKNRDYQQRIDQLGPRDLLPGAHAAIEAVRAAGLGVALASASRNAPRILSKLGIAGLFDYIVDAAKIEHSKPAPDIYLDAAKGLGVRPDVCLGVEDAVAGLASIRAAGMSSLGIGNAEILVDADAVLATLTHFDPLVFMAGQASPARPTQVSAKQRSNDSTDPEVER